MEGRTKNTNGRSGYGELPDSFQFMPDEIFVLSPEDQEILEKAGEIITAESDLKEIINDPGYESAQAMAPGMISEYKNKPFWSRDNAKFVIEAVEETLREKLINSEIREIRTDAKLHGVDTMAEGWVSAWAERKENGIYSAGERSNKEFLSAALTDEVEEAAEKYQMMTVIDRRNKKPARIIRYFSIPAAAALLAFMMLRFFATAETPEILFKKYYQPAVVVSAVTRGLENDYSTNFSAGIEKYRNGDYSLALHHFALAMNADRAATGPEYYYGISSLALGDYRTAKNYLVRVAESEGDFVKDARWYLGLAYLMTDEKEKAIECFRELASSPGYYREKALKILRRLR